MRTLLSLLLLGLTACGAGHRERRPVVVVDAAASLRDVAAEIGREFERRQSIEVVFNFAGSNTLAQQIKATPKADVFLSADQRWVDVLDRAGRLAPGSRRPQLSNRLVLVAHRGSRVAVASPGDLATARYHFLAVGDPEAVPAGRYARAYLERRMVGGASLWSRLAGRLAPAQDVRAALALVESDPVILGIVYKTDALTAEKIRVVYEFPPLDEVPIIYWEARVAGGEAPEQGALFLRFLHGPEARAIIERYGFVPR